MSVERSVKTNVSVEVVAEPVAGRVAASTSSAEPTASMQGLGGRKAGFDPVTCQIAACVHEQDAQVRGGLDVLYAATRGEF